MSKKSIGISQFVSSVLLILIIVFGLIIASNFGKDIMDKINDNIVINEALQNMKLLNDVIQEVGSEGEMARRTLSVSVTNGKYEFDPYADSINFSYYMKSDLNFTGSIENINISRDNGRIKLYIQYEKIDIVSYEQFGTGNNLVTIINEGINTELNKPIINISKT